MLAHERLAELGTEPPDIGPKRCVDQFEFRSAHSSNLSQVPRYQARAR